VCVVLLALANSLDLTERALPLLRAKGLTPRHMVFAAYSRPQARAREAHSRAARHPAVGPCLRACTCGVTRDGCVTV
jgi:hypothetical protein